MKRSITLTVAALAVAAATISAHAGCVDPRSVKPEMAHTIPAYLLPKAHSGALMKEADASKKIVGTWIATYTNGGQPFGQAFIQWHNDGTEWENINLPVESGNLCMGEWVAVDNKDVSRNHIGWLYTNGTLSGYFTETETDRLTAADTYKGTNDTKIFDLSGNLLEEVAGTSDAVRLAP